MSNTPRHEPGVFHASNGDRPPLPAPSCVVDSAAIDRLEFRLQAVERQGEKTEKTVEQVLRAIIGHPEYGHTGVVGRQDKTEIALLKHKEDTAKELNSLKSEDEKINRKLFRFGTIFSLAWIILTGVLVLGKDLLVAWITGPHKP